MTWKVPVFDMFYVISQPFLKLSTWNFVHIFMRHCPLTYVTVIWKFWFGGNCFEKKKTFGHFFENFRNFQNFENPWYQFCSAINSTPFHISQLIVALKLNQWRWFPWTHFAGQNRRNMTSLWRHSRLTYYDLGPNFLTQDVELLSGEVLQVSKRNSQYFGSYLRKTTGGPLPPPPSEARDKSKSK